MQLIQHFHPSIWKANKKNKPSPFEGWKSINCLLESIENRLKYKGTELSPKDIRMGLTLSQAAPKVSVMRPSMAKYILKKYAEPYTQIFDPCSGYSGRLLGAASLGKNYIGQDINPKTIQESKNLIEYFELTNVCVNCKNSLATKGSYECLFTCPPYGDKENWNQDIECLSSDDWIDICLKNYTCHRYIFIVDKTVKYQKNIVEEITNNSHLTKSHEYILIIDR